MFAASLPPGLESGLSMWESFRWMGLGGVLSGYSGFLQHLQLVDYSFICVRQKNVLREIEIRNSNPSPLIETLLWGQFIFFTSLPIPMYSNTHTYH